ncbi:MAG TPA: hypothetical protein DCS07_15130 [Bdellovibrionales bacterium]|nr:MAG: hypothetical protein A2070_10805 [Bdellovibrionales bacterium GWC1_52_8]HAR43944.1 hypothetical protein [Bdellovibrionales bacterium]
MAVDAVRPISVNDRCCIQVVQLNVGGAVLIVADVTALLIAVMSEAGQDSIGISYLRRLNPEAAL